MLKNLFKILIIVTIFFSTTYASNQTNNTNIQKELTNIKIELEKIKLTQHYEKRDNKIVEIEQSIKDLEDKLNNTIEKDIAKQDNRISDIGFYLTTFGGFLTFLGTLITVIIIFFAFRYESIARNQADKEVKLWIDEKADAEFKPKVKEYLQEIEDKSNILLEQIREEADNINKDHKEKIIEYDLMVKKQLSDVEREKLDKDVQNLGEDASSYSFDDWYSKFLQKYYNKEYKIALEFIENALLEANSDQQLLFALYAKGLVLGDLNRREESIKEYNKVISIFEQNENENEIIIDIIARSLFNKGVNLSILGKTNKAIQEYENVIDKFIDKKNEIILDTVARAVFNKGVILKNLRKELEAIKEYEKVISIFGESKYSRIMDTVVKALLDKAFILNLLGKNKEALIVYDMLINKYSDSENEDILELVTQASKYKKEIESQLTTSTSSSKHSAHKVPKRAV